MICCEENKQEIQIEDYGGWEEEKPTVHRISSKCFFERVMFKLRLKNGKELVAPRAKGRAFQAEVSTYAKAPHIEDPKVGVCG